MLQQTCALASPLSPAAPWRTLQLRILHAQPRPLDVPLLAPFTIASTRLDCLHNVAIRLHLQILPSTTPSSSSEEAAAAAGGMVGWGEVPTLPPVTAETQPIALHKASHACAHLLHLHHHRPTTCIQLLNDLHDLLPGPNSASVRAGVEMAIVDALSRSIGLPLWQFFGGASNSVITDITIPICTPPEAASLASKYVERGFSVLKLKVGGRTISEDLETLLAIHNQCKQSQFILDANEAYKPDEALELLKQLHEAGITPILLEQPVPKYNWTELGYVNRMAKDLYGVPVAADESCRSLHDAERIARDHLADVINIKLAKLGVLGALEVIEFAKVAGLDLMIGGMVETRLAMGFAAHLAAGQGCFKYVDLDTPLLLAGDPVLGGYEGIDPTSQFNSAPLHNLFHGCLHEYTISDCCGFTSQTVWLK